MGLLEGLVLLLPSKATVPFRAEDDFLDASQENSLRCTGHVATQVEGVSIIPYGQTQAAQQDDTQRHLRSQQTSTVLRNHYSTQTFKCNEAKGDITTGHSG